MLCRALPSLSAAVAGLRQEEAGLQDGVDWGVLDRRLIEGPEPVDSTIRILVILPDNWEFVRQGTLSAHNACPPAQMGESQQQITFNTKKQPTLGGSQAETHSRPPSALKTSPRKVSSPATLPRKEADQETAEEGNTGMIRLRNTSTQLTADEIPITQILVQTQTTCWKINWLQVALIAPRKREKEQTLQNRPEAKDPQQREKRSLNL